MTHHVALLRRGGVALVSLGLASALLLGFANTASAAIVPNVGMGSAGLYAVLAGAGVTNTGNTTMNMNMGSSPLEGDTGFPPGIVSVPGVIDHAGAAAAQLSLTTAYDDAHDRVVTDTIPANLSGQQLFGGVYAGPAKAPLILPGVLTLNGGGNPNTVFIFQTNSSLITGVGSTVSLVNGAQECNVFWQVLSDATIGGGSTFVGNIFALTSITMGGNATIHGRALARNGNVTLINDHFTTPTCATALPTTTITPGPVVTTAAPGPGTTSPAPGGGVGATTTTAAGGGSGTPTTGPGGTGNGATTTSLGLTVGIVGPPKTGVAPSAGNGFPWPAALFAGVGGSALAGVIVRRRLRSDGVSR